jgi:hypothetical protein
MEAPRHEKIKPHSYSSVHCDRVELVSAVFADGTYEGQTGLAALIKGTALGTANISSELLRLFVFMRTPNRLK